MCPELNVVLLEHHGAALLIESGIAEAVVIARGYRSVSKKAELAELGFATWQRQVPTLLIPIWGAGGKIALYHHRPDVPRRNSKSGKIIKYEFPAKSVMCLDVHPFIREQMRDPKIPLWITEGIKKVDSAISRGMCFIGLLGVWNWRGTNEHGGKMALSDWDDIALDGREVNLVFDADFATNRSVYEAQMRLRAFLRRRGAIVHIVDLNKVQLPGRSDVS